MVDMTFIALLTLAAAVGLLLLAGRAVRRAWVRARVTRQLDTTAARLAEAARQNNTDEFDGEFLAKLGRYCHAYNKAVIPRELYTLIEADPRFFPPSRGGA